MAFDDTKTEPLIAIGCLAVVSALAAVGWWFLRG